MKDKAMQLINTRMDKLDADDFDLEAWKSGTVAILQRLLPENDPRTRDISELKIDYSSWALRDSNSQYNPIATCKKKGRSILEAIHDEIEIMGLTFEAESDRVNPLAILAGEISDVDSSKLKDRGLRLKTLKSLKKDDLVQVIEKMLENL